MTVDSYAVRALTAIFRGSRSTWTAQRYPRPHILFHKQRVLGARHHVQQITTSVNVVSEDACIPFDSNIRRGIAKPESYSARTASTPEGLDQDVGKLEEDGRLAEIELTLPTCTPTVQEVSGSTEEYDRNRPLYAGSSKTPINATDGLHVSGSHQSRLAQSEECSTQEQSETKNGAISKTSANRAASRLERKLRRIEAGKHNKLSKDHLTQSDDGKVVQTKLALELIDRMPGTNLHTESLNKHQASAEARPKATTQKANPRQRDKSQSKKARASRTTVGEGKPKTARAKVQIERKPKKENWQVQKAALGRKFGGLAWQPGKRLSPDTLDGIRTLHASDPASYSTEIIAKHFEVSPEAIRRVLKSKWKPKETEVEDRRERWQRRGVRKWQEMADREGMKPPAKWRAMGVTAPRKTPEGKPIWTKKTPTSRPPQDRIRWADVAGDARRTSKLRDGRSLDHRIL